MTDNNICESLARGTVTVGSAFTDMTEQHSPPLLTKDAITSLYVTCTLHCEDFHKQFFGQISEAKFKF